VLNFWETVPMPLQKCVLTEKLGDSKTEPRAHLWVKTLKNQGLTPVRSTATLHFSATIKIALTAYQSKK
jgi:hypothetical protein